jgi:hypothetical protein
MRPLFQRPLFQRRVAAGPVTAARENEAYREGRVDERRVEDRGAVASPSTSAAYRQGRSDARARRRGPGILSLLVLVVVVFGAVMLYLAARNGSFAQGGAVIDHSLANAEQPVRNAEGKTGAALENAGEHLKQAAGSPSQ